MQKNQFEVSTTPEQEPCPADKAVLDLFTSSQSVIATAADGRLETLLFGLLTSAENENWHNKNAYIQIFLHQEEGYVGIVGLDEGDE